MNSILARIYRKTKRLDSISRRFTFIMGLLLICHSHGYAGFSFAPTPVIKQFVTVDTTKFYNRDSIETDSTDIDTVLSIKDSAVIGADSLQYPLSSTEDSTITNETDSSDNEDIEDTQWTVDAGVNYRTKDQKSGVELSGGKPVIGSSVDITHVIGMGLSFSSAHRLVNGGAQFQDLSYGINYIYSAASWMDLEVELTGYKYASDTANALAAQTGSISLAADFYINKFIIDLSIDRYFGADKQTYLSLSGLWLFNYNDLAISPLASISIVSYEISNKRLKAKTNTVQTVTKNKLSLSSVMASVVLTYPIYSGLSATLTPAYSYSPLDDLTTKHSQFTATVGIKYSLDF